MKASSSHFAITVWQDLSKDVRIMISETDEVRYLISKHGVQLNLTCLKKNIHNKPLLITSPQEKAQLQYVLEFTIWKFN